MFAKELISDTVPYLRTSDSGLDALNWMEIFRVSHLPIVNDEEFLGLITDNDIYDMNMADEPIGNHNLSLLRPYVYDYQHIYEVIEIASRLKLTVVPVLTNESKFLGIITLTDLVHNFGSLLAVQNPGGVIVLELNIHDYSLTEIAHIVESNDAKILSAYISTPSNSTKLEVTLKINRIDLTSIVQTFYRYDYEIKASFMRDDELDNITRERVEEFLTYLNV
jgi:CBS domain-containing protein